MLLEYHYKIFRVTKIQQSFKLKCHAIAIFE